MGMEGPDQRPIVLAKKQIARRPKKKKSPSRHREVGKKKGERLGDAGGGAFSIKRKKAV